MWIEALLVGAGATTAVVAVLQMTTDLSSYGFQLAGRRPLVRPLGQPVYLSGFLVGAVWLVVPRLRARPAV